MSIRKISSLASIFVVTLCLTGCGNSSTYEPKEERLGWNAKNKMDLNKQSEELQAEVEAQKLNDDAEDSEDTF